LAGTACNADLREAAVGSKRSRAAAVDEPRQDAARGAHGWNARAAVPDAGAAGARVRDLAGTSSAARLAVVELDPCGRAVQRSPHLREPARSRRRRDSRRRAGSSHAFASARMPRGVPRSRRRGLHLTTAWPSGRPGSVHVDDERAGPDEGQDDLLQLVRRVDVAMNHAHGNVEESARLDVGALTAARAELEACAATDDVPEDFSIAVVVPAGGRTRLDASTNEHRA